MYAKSSRMIGIEVAVDEVIIIEYSNNLSIILTGVSFR